MTQETPKKEFDYCFWSKFICGVPALFVAGFSAAVAFQGQGLMQFAAAGTTVLVLVIIAIKVESIPALKKKICKK
jgi:hypothetical protein